MQFKQWKFEICYQLITFYQKKIRKGSILWLKFYFWTYDNFLNLWQFPEPAAFYLRPATRNPWPVTHDMQQLDTPITDQVLMRVCG